MQNTIQSIAQFFQEAGHAHHQAFIETDGADPEWPLWYANYMQARLSELLQHPFTVSEVVYWVIRLDKEYRAKNPSEPWPTHYGKILVAEFL